MTIIIYSGRNVAELSVDQWRRELCWEDVSRTRQSPRLTRNQGEGYVLSNTKDRRSLCVRRQR
jgi:hypothetical protein